LGVLASQLNCFSILAYKILNCLPNIMITTYLAIDDILHELKKGKFLRRNFHSNRRLDGKTAVVTGGNTGIGFETTKDLAKRGARVLMLCLHKHEAEDAMKRIEAELGQVKGTGEVSWKLLNLASQESIEKCSNSILADEERIDILVLNAGVLSLSDTPKMKRTPDGFELHMGINYLGHYALTRRLLQLLRSTAKTSEDGVRIVATASSSHMKPMVGRIPLDDLHWKKSTVGGITAYGYSKLAVVMFMRELGKRLRGSGVTTYSVHPGAVLTPLSSHCNSQVTSHWPKILIRAGWEFQRRVFKTPEEGVQTSLFCCVDESLSQETGKYYDNCAAAEPSPNALIDSDSRRLWELGAEITGTSHLEA